MGNVIEIYGAGISGLVAAIELARSGRRVSVVEKGDNIGDSKDWHPSIQFSAFDIEATSKFVGVDLNSCFERVVFQRRYLSIPFKSYPPKSQSRITRHSSQVKGSASWK